MDLSMQVLAVALGLAMSVVPLQSDVFAQGVDPLREWTVGLGGMADVAIADGPPAPRLYPGGRPYHEVPERSRRTVAGARLVVATRLSARGSVSVEHERPAVVTFDRTEPMINPFFYTHRLRSTYTTDLTTFLLGFQPRGWRRFRPACLVGLGFERSVLDEEIYDRGGTVVVYQHRSETVVPVFSLGVDAAVPITRRLALAAGLRWHIVWTTGYGRIRPHAGLQWCFGC